MGRPTKIVSQKKPTKAPSLSGGAKKDLLVLHFALALLTIATERMDDLHDSDVTVREDNKNHKLNKRIDRRLAHISTVCNDTLNDLYQKEEGSLARWAKKQVKTKIVKMLATTDSFEVSLEHLSIFILYVNFDESERCGVKLFDELKPIGRLSGYLLDTSVLFEESEVAHLEGSMFDLAVSYIKTIKA